MRYIAGHQRYKSLALYIEQDCGYKTPCWIWQRSLGGGGYGHFWLNGRTQRAHVYYYEQKYGPVPNGLELDHLCRQRRCCNPDHVEAVTHVVNARRGAKTKLTEEQRAELKRLYVRGKYRSGQECLGRLFGVSASAVRDVVSPTTDGPRARGRRAHLSAQDAAHKAVAQNSGSMGH